VKILHPKTALWFFSLGLISACAPDNVPSGPNLMVPGAIRLAVLDAPGLISAARGGRLGRGEEDFLVRLEDRLPGFGGLYIADGEVRVYMKSSTPPAHSPSAIRGLLVAAYATHPNLRNREAVANLARATILPARYSLAELIAIENRIASSPVSLPGWTGAGASISSNRVVIMFEDSVTLAHGLAVMESIGVPLDALAPMVIRQAQPAYMTWLETYRPTRAGLEVAVGNDTRIPGYWWYDGKTGAPRYFTWAKTCSLGFNVRSTSGADYFMTAAHCANTYAGINGELGDTVFQVSRINGGPIGPIVFNPPYDQGAACPFDPGSLKSYDYCTTADVALGAYFPGIWFERKVATAGTGGINGRVGSLDIHGFWPINGFLSPEYVDTGLHHDLAKSGYASSTTSGPIIFTMGPVRSSICFNRADQPCAQSTFLWRNATQIRAVCSGGDSGAPVFTGNPNNGAPYAAVGILVGCTGFTSLPCADCATTLARWDMIEARLGIGQLRPETNLP